jgi:hypothetical protein
MTQGKGRPMSQGPEKLQSQQNNWVEPNKSFNYPTEQNFYRGQANV